MSLFVRSLVCCACVLGLPSLALGQVEGEAVPPAEAAPIGQLSGKVAYNTEDEFVLGFGFLTERLFGRDQSLRVDAEAMSSGTRLSFSYLNDQIAGGSPRFGLRVFRTDSKPGDAYDFDSQVLGVSPRLTWDLGDSGTGSLYALYSDGEISNVAADASILIRDDEGGQTASVVGVDVNLRFPGTGGVRRDTRLTFDVSYGSTSRGNDFLRYVMGLDMLFAPASENVVLRSQLRTGGIDSKSGTTSIGDRFMLGDSSIRGFAFGGFGPRDLASGEAALGGNRFAVARFDAQFPTLFGEGAERLTPGVFVDVGSLWGLDNAAGGPLGADAVDDSQNLRASAGITLKIDTGFGPIDLYAAHPFEKEDYDSTQAIGLIYSRRF